MPTSAPTTTDDGANGADTAALEARLRAARAAMDAEVAALAHERAVRLAPLQRELDAASGALARTPGRQAPVSLASRGDSRVWTLIARRLGVGDFGATDIVEIAHGLRHTDIERNVTTRKLWTWRRRGHIERSGTASYRFTAAGRTRYRIDTAAATAVAAPARPRTPLTVAGAMIDPAARRRRIPSGDPRERPPEPHDAPGTGDRTDG